MNLFDQLTHFIQIIDPAPYLLIGGMAYSVYTEPRFTEDIDVMISQKDMNYFRDQLNQAGFINQQKPWRFEKAVIQRSVIIIEGDESCIIDMLIEPDETFDEYYKKKQMIQYQNVEIHVIHPLDLIELKHRRNSAQDQIDIEQIKKMIQS